MSGEIPYTPNDKQALFHASPCEEVFFGGAKGPGKSCALVMEGFAYGMEYPGAKVYFFRETYDDLEANIIDEWRSKIPEITRDNSAGYYVYNGSKHMATMINGTRVYFRYISNDKDAEKYQGRSMDWIGIDELCKHTEKAVQILLSCLRSPKGFPPRFRATGNPGGKGHVHVKERYVVATDYGQKIIIDPITGNRIQFIPGVVYDNYVLMANDPAYAKRLENLPEDQKKAFLFGDWDIFAGQFFPELKRHIHIVKHFNIPDYWKRFRCIDYGLDMLACLWIAIDEHGHGYVYRAVSGSNLNLTAAAKLILEHSREDEHISYTVASPDLWNRNKDTGKPEAETMTAAGLKGLIPADARRIPGWREVREWITPYDTVNQDGEQVKDARLKLLDFPEVVTVYNDMVQLMHEENDFEDAADEPHEITHRPEALRYGIMSRPPKAITPEDQKKRAKKRREQMKPRRRITGT